MNQRQKNEALKRKIDANEYFYPSVTGFVAPDGEFYQVKDTKHEAQATEIIERYNMQDEDFESNCDILQACGWVHLTTSHLVFDVNQTGLKLTRPQEETLYSMTEDLSPKQLAQLFDLT